MIFINNREIKAGLIKHDVNELYHANTVQTALLFLSEGGLLSRGAVEDKRLFQTSQLSDYCDKKYDIWYDIFFDSTDIHERIHRRNKYGPVSFVFNLDFINKADLDIEITRTNPFDGESGNWDDIEQNERYLNSMLLFRKGNFGQSITIRHMHEALPLTPYLKRIVLDNPCLENNIEFERAQYSLSEEIKLRNLPYELTIRKCLPECSCRKQYSSYKQGAIFYMYNPKQKSS